MGILVVEYDKQVCAKESSVHIQLITEASKWLSYWGLADVTKQTQVARTQGQLPWRLKHSWEVPLCVQLFPSVSKDHSAQQHTFLTQNTWIFSNTTVRISHLMRVVKLLQTLTRKDTHVVYLTHFRRRIISLSTNLTCLIWNQ